LRTQDRKEIPAPWEKKNNQIKENEEEEKEALEIGMDKFFNIRKKNTFFLEEICQQQIFYKEGLSRQFNKEPVWIRRGSIIKSSYLKTALSYASLWNQADFG
jgi:hypothetical protein